VVDEHRRVVGLESGDLLGFASSSHGVDGLSHSHLRLDGLQVLVELELRNITVWAIFGYMLSTK